MSILVALFMALVFIPMHACNARHTLGFYNMKHVRKQRSQEMDIAFPAFEAKKEKILGSKITMPKEMDGTEGAAEVHGLKMIARSMLESGSSQEVKKPADENETTMEVENEGEMDYVLAHRKSPIHNHH